MRRTDRSLFSAREGRTSSKRLGTQKSRLSAGEPDGEQRETDLDNEAVRWAGLRAAMDVLNS